MTEYQRYLQSQHWLNTRILKLIHSDFKCEVCGAKQHLEIHHLHYNTLWCEKMSDLQCLCDIHHAAAHNNGKVDLDAIADARINRKMQEWQRSMSRFVDVRLEQVTSRDVPPSEWFTPEEHAEIDKIYNDL